MLHPKTAYVLLWFPEPTETFIYREVENLAKSGLPTFVFTLYGPVRQELAPSMASPPVPVERLGIRTIASLIPALWFWARRRPSATTTILRKTFLRRWGGLVQTGENLWAVLCGFQLARRFLDLGMGHAHAPWSRGAATAAWVASSLVNIPFSFTARARDLYLADTALSAKAHAASFIRVNTKANLLHLRGIVPHAKEKIHCIYNGVNPSMGEGNAAALRPPFRLLAVGRFVAKKGYDVLLNACAELANSDFDFTLTLAGDGPLSGSLRRLASDLALDSKVSFPGFVPYDKVPPLFTAADVFVMPCVIDPSGDRDGIPNVLMEALLHRVPVVASDVSGIGELVVNGETGLLVSSGDPTALAEAIREMTSKPDWALEMAERGRAAVLEKFDPGESSRKITDLIDGSRPGDGGW